MSSTPVSHINFKKNPKNTPNCTEEKKVAIVTFYVLTPRCHLSKIVSNIECPGGLEHIGKHLIKCHWLYRTSNIVHNSLKNPTRVSRITDCLNKQSVILSLPPPPHPQSTTINQEPWELTQELWHFLLAI